MEEVLNILDHDQNGKIDIEDLFNFVVVKMKLVKKDKKLTGDEKKYLVLNEIERIFGTEVIDKYKPVIEEFIRYHFNKYMKKCSKLICS